jgi:hypothetical protein
LISIDHRERNKMMQTAVNKAIRVGRATILAIGVGVVLALVLGVSTVALAAVPGDPFKLGRVNIINNATTALQGGAPDGGAMLDLRRGSGKGPVLNIENSNPASNSRGVNIQVAAGQTPITVNPDAGKASNLNADELDGRDEQDFLSASRLYGKTALRTGPGGGDTVLFTALDGPEGLACDEGDVALDASANANDINDDLNNITRSSAGSYQIEFQDNGDGGGQFRASILCSDSSKPFRE